MDKRAISLVGWIVACVCPVAAIGSEPAAGTIVKSFDFPATKFALDPNQPILYATSLTRNSLGIFNTNSLEMIDEVPTGIKPTDLAVSPDGSKVYVANSGGKSLSVLDVHTHHVDTLPLSFSPLGVACGNDGRLWLISDFVAPALRPQIVQVDAKSGASSGPSPQNVFVDGGMLEVSPDRQKLYYGNSGVSPASLYEMDITGPDPQLLWQNQHSSLGSNGENLEISHDGAMLAFVAGSGIPSRVSCCNTPILRTSDKSILEILEMAAYPLELTFSPDDKFAYGVFHQGEIYVYETNYGQPTAVWGTQANFTNELIVDRTGRYLFAASPAELLVFATGREVSVPEPGSLVFAVMLLPGICIARARRRSSGYVIIQSNSAQIGEMIEDLAGS